MYIVGKGGVGYGIKPSSFIFSVLLILVLFSKKIENLFNYNNFLLMFVTWLGKISFSLYLTHYIIKFALNILLNNHIWIVNWLLTLLFSILFIIILRKLIPISLHKYLGL